MATHLSSTLLFSFIALFKFGGVFGIVGCLEASGHYSYLGHSHIQGIYVGVAPTLELHLIVLHFDSVQSHEVL